MNETLERDHVYPTLMQKGERASSSGPRSPSSHLMLGSVLPGKEWLIDGQCYSVTYA
ncbi:MAG: hypothetical protein GTO63_29000 [Anaerolineae bacterium]|nr:hypothetical protein [Anaerolineae bacterium]NIN96220.1 hypothetical protein [Anaerolineae bacterium]